jgi:hypothetical protein
MSIATPPASATSGPPQVRTDEEQTGTFTEPDMEKLGRERPKIFASIFSEICFVFSIVMSQILAVSSTTGNFIQKETEADLVIGVLHHRIQRLDPYSCKRLEYSDSIDDMANHSSLTRHLCYTFDMGPVNRHVRRLPSIQCRCNLALHILNHCWVFTVMANVDFLPRMPRISTRCFAALRHDDSR